MRKQEVERKRRMRMANALDQLKDILQENTVSWIQLCYGKITRFTRLVIVVPVLNNDHKYWYYFINFERNLSLTTRAFYKHNISKH